MPRSGNLSEGEKQVVEILKALYRGAKILILDEPTSALAPPETEESAGIHPGDVQDELAIVPFITHKLPIVLSDQRPGDGLAARQSHRPPGHRSMQPRKSWPRKWSDEKSFFGWKEPRWSQGNQSSQVENLSALSDKGITAVNGVSFTIREGEIFGIAGVSGNGQQELAEVLAGLRKAEGGQSDASRARTSRMPPAWIDGRTGWATSLPNAWMWARSVISPSWKMWR